MADTIEKMGHLKTTDYTNLSDKELTLLVSRGDHEAFRLLFDRYRSMIYRFCFLMLSDKTLAEDVYQEAFLALYEACEKQESIVKAGGYLLTVARRRCLNVLRDSHNHLSLDEIVEPVYTNNFSDVALDHHLQKALQSLPPHYREAFVLFEIEGYSYDEIVQYTNTGYDIVKNRIYRAKKALQKTLNPILQEGIDL